MKQSRISNTTLILGFYDGIHLGHREVINSAVEFANENKSKTVLLTFSNSPAEYFKSNAEYIFPREYNYKIIKTLGVNEIDETEFGSLINISAEDYLSYIVSKFSPIGIFSGFNYTFGANRKGTAELLEKSSNSYNYKYSCISPVMFQGQTVSSTLIKKYLTEGDIETANKLLVQPFNIASTVIKGDQIGRTIGFPTANMNYPPNIIKIPFGVYKVKISDKTALLNWGIKPTVNGKKPILEVHIPNFENDLYGQELNFQILKRIRNEKKFNTLNELKQQIKKDIEECLE